MGAGYHAEPRLMIVSGDGTHDTYTGETSDDGCPLGHTILNLGKHLLMIRLVWAESCPPSLDPQ